MVLSEILIAIGALVAFLISLFVITEAARVALKRIGVPEQRQEEYVGLVTLAYIALIAIGVGVYVG